jgi:hypothetical protein
MNGNQSTTKPTKSMRTLSLVKGKDQYLFRYEEGQEADVLHSLVDMVNRRDVSFDWFDAAVLSHQLGQHLSKELKGYLPKKVA